MKITLKQYLTMVKPKSKGMSDKYSWNLYTFLKSKGYKNLKIYYQNISSWSGNRYEENNLEDKLKNPSRIWFSYSQDECGTDTMIIGNTLSRILTGKKSLSSTIWKNKMELEEMDKEYFLDKYQENGRCLLFKHNDDFYILGDESRFKYENKDTRMCNWCGSKQLAVRKTVETEEVEWEEC